MILQFFRRSFPPRFSPTIPNSQAENSKPSMFGDSVGTTVGSGLPPQADEVLELATSVRTTLSDMLMNQKLLVGAVEMRRRLSTREFRAYITLRSTVDIEHLANLEHLLRAEVNRVHRIEIANMFWCYQPPSH